LIGLDIGSKNIKLCQVEKKDGKYHLLAAMMASLPDIPAGTVANDAVSRRIREMLREADCFERVAASAAGGAQILARNFSFPVLAGEELASAVALEANQSISSGTDSMYSDFQVLPSEDKGKVEVLFAAVPREPVDRDISIAREAGLDIRMVDIDNLALTNCFLELEPDPAKESVILLNIGCTCTSLAVIDCGQLRFVRNVNVGGSHITAEIARSFGVAPEAAEEMKQRPELWKEVGLNIKDILRKSLPDLLEAVYRSIDYCMNRKKLMCVDRILMTGGSAALYGLDSFINDTLGIHAERWNPLMFMAMGGDARKELGHTLAVAIGLGMRGEKNV
jgi:type IV pilus assembly protein PilM